MYVHACTYVSNEQINLRELLFEFQDELQIYIDTSVTFERLLWRLQIKF